MNDPIDAAEVVAEMLREELPGFASRVNPMTQAVEIRGALPIGATATREALIFPVNDGGGYAERGITRDLVREANAYVVKKLVETIRKLAIEAVNLEPTIAALLQRERHRASVEAFATGRIRGRIEGRAEILAELAEAAKVMREASADDE